MVRSHDASLVGRYIADLEARKAECLQEEFYEDAKALKQAILQLTRISQEVRSRCYC